MTAFLATALALGLILHLCVMVRKSRIRTKAAEAADRMAIQSVVDTAVDRSTGTAGVITFEGKWQDLSVQVRTIIDTLAVRKLPVRWLSVSILEPVAVDGVFDMMMRPAAPTSFSNFDLLAHTLPTPAGFPDGAVVRTDRVGRSFPAARLAGRLGLFAEGRAKELLITPAGVRIVWLLAEADRARYGVFRQAEFADAAIDPVLLERLIGEAAGLRVVLNRGVRQAA